MKKIAACALFAICSAAPVAAFGQGTDVTTRTATVFCPSIPKTGQPISCKDVPANMSLVATGSLSEPWIEAKLGPDKGFVRAADLNLPFATNDPCVDSLYRSLKKRDLKELTEREYQYLLERDRACTEFQRTVASTEPQVRAAQSAERMERKATNWFTVAMVISALSGIVAYLAVSP